MKIREFNGMRDRGLPDNPQNEVAICSSSGSADIVCSKSEAYLLAYEILMFLNDNPYVEE
jgi:hypothetical protein